MAALGAQGPERGREERGVSTLLAMLAFVPTAHFYLGRWTRRQRGGAEAAAGRLRRCARRRRAAALPGEPRSGGFSAIVFGVLFLLAPDGPHALARPGYWTPGHAVAWIGVPVLGWMTGRFAHALIHHAQQISRLATDLRRIELLDPAPLAPFVQQGLGGALLVMVMLAVGAAGAVGQEPVLPTVLAIIATLVGVGTAALVLPVLGVRGRVRSEKQRQLAALRERIAVDRGAVLEGGAETGPAAARLPGLLALETRLEAVREWPFDVSSLLRFAFYLALGLGSWLGAAFVERLLDAALG